jgi:hypothetical protein
MNRQPRKKSGLSCLSLAMIFNVIAIVTMLPILAGLVWLRATAAPGTDLTSQELFQGITYQRLERRSPRPIVFHVAVIDLRAKGLSFLVTPGNPRQEQPLKARTTSQFLSEFDLQLAINGDGFTPWHANNPFDYYPRPGDPVTPNGLAASKGQVYAQSRGREPVLYLSNKNQAQFNSPPGRIYNAISGTHMLVARGKAVSFKDLEADTAEPRSAVGIDKRGRRLILVVVDGRQPGYSEGVTLAELAQILVEFGAYNGMNLDGGGSTTLVKQGPGGSATLLNSPIHTQIPGRERPVGNHLGIYARPAQED